MQAGGREFESLYLHLLSKESRTLYLENCIYETSKNTLNVDRDENEALRKQRTRRETNQATKPSDINAIVSERAKQERAQGGCLGTESR